MAFPSSWPPIAASNSRSIRFFKTGTTTGDFADNAYIFSSQTGANTYTTIPVIQPGSTATISIGNASPGGTNITQVCANTIQITNDSANDIEISFDGTNVQGLVKEGETICWRDRHEAGIALRFPGGGAASDFRLEAW